MTTADTPRKAQAPPDEDRHQIVCVAGYSDCFCDLWQDFCAPQVLYFTPRRKWYLIYQVNDSDRKMLQPAFSTTANIADPASWTPPVWLFTEHPEKVKAWIDFWMIHVEATDR